MYVDYEEHLELLSKAILSFKAKGENIREWTVIDTDCGIEQMHVSLYKWGHLIAVDINGKRVYDIHEYEFNDELQLFFKVLDIISAVSRFLN